jgi:hypothetical protein
MKKCPSCYAIMRESTKPTPVPALQRQPSDNTPVASAARVRFECSQFLMAGMAAPDYCVGNSETDLVYYDLLSPNAPRSCWFFRSNSAISCCRQVIFARSKLTSSFNTSSFELSRIIMGIPNSGLIPSLVRVHRAHRQVPLSWRGSPLHSWRMFFFDFLD